MGENLSRKRILVVDDEDDVAALVAYHLRAKDFLVESITDSTKAMEIARQFNPDLVILDVMMPVMNGMQICRALRTDPAFKQLPVFFLTAKTEDSDKVQGLESGADDYISKPFNYKELILRIQALFRRMSSSPSTLANRLQMGDITLDVDRHEATVGGTKIDLTATEFKLLHLLMERRGRVQTREHLLVDVWNYETEIETRTVDTHVRRLREKLGSEADWIETIRGVGYRMAEVKVKS